jgi:hypothetical protein
VLDDVRPYTAAATVNHIATFGWERLDHAPYNPELAPSDFHFFPTLQRTLEGRRFTTNEDVEEAVRTQDTDFYQQGFFKLVKRWDKCINVSGTMVKNSRLMSRSAHIGVYLVHVVSCRWRTWETYFPTIPRICCGSPASSSQLQHQNTSEDPFSLVKKFRISSSVSDRFTEEA